MDPPPKNPKVGTYAIVKKKRREELEAHIWQRATSYDTKKVCKKLSLGNASFSRYLVFLVAKSMDFGGFGPNPKISKIWGAPVSPAAVRRHRGVSNRSPEHLYTKKDW